VTKSGSVRAHATVPGQQWLGWGIGPASHGGADEDAVLGMRVGRPRSLTPEKLDMAHRLLAEGKGRAVRYKPGQAERAATMPLRRSEKGRSD